jgi:hypothetical protein
MRNAIQIHCVLGGVIVGIIMFSVPFPTSFLCAIAFIGLFVAVAIGR